ncbi:hypothetical protein L6452_08492 [Arctium lappa]|uniref:Uncharacterized protein n=1 Tax=Arctium lappa TaxID=4217 RepID=A0ACB9DHQ8_ARCLA|nr:hypothetical protein L6452_08492 [Arctium lappa]
MLLADDKIWDQNGVNDLMHRQLGPSVDEESGLVYAYDHGSLKLGFLPARLQEKFSEKSRQKRKLDEMYDQLRSEYESVKRSAIQAANNFFSGAEPDLFASPANMMDNRDSMRKDWSFLTPETPRPREDIWPPTTRQNSGNSGQFDISISSPVKHSAMPLENRRVVGRPMFGGGGGAGGGGYEKESLGRLKKMKYGRLCLAREDGEKGASSGIGIEIARDLALRGVHVFFLTLLDIRIMQTGFKAFGAMRARGARVTDIAIIVMADDDCIRPQITEA